MKSVARRLKKIFSDKEKKIDAILIVNTGVQDSNFLYLTEFTSGVFENDMLIAFPDREILLTTPLEFQIAKRQKPKEMSVMNVKSRAELVGELNKHLEGKTVGFNEDFLPEDLYKRLRKNIKAKSFVDASEMFFKARDIKDADEIADMRKAIHITKKAFGEIREDLREGMTERQLAAEFDNIMMRNGAEKFAFDTIVAFGGNAGMPHHMPDNTKLKPNSFVLIDAGAKYNNYCADMTRTLIFEPDRKSNKYRRMREMIKIIKDAQRIALSKIKPGVDGSTVHEAAENFIDSARGYKHMIIQSLGHGTFKGEFIHGLGHSIGIDVHDGDIALSKGFHIKLKEGMVFSDEPGIYIPGVGGVRFEDDLVVTKKGAKFI